MERSQSVVVFDLGEVLVPSARVFEELTGELGVTRESLAEAYWPGRRDYDLGGDGDHYWSEVLARLGKAPDVGARVRDLDAQKWSQLPEASATLLATVAGTPGVRVGVLSNAPAALAAAVRAAPWSAVVDTLVFSADLGLVKPDLRIYAAADAAYGCDPAEVIFFDDQADNVAAARAHGWNAHQWAGVQSALARLHEYGIG